MMNETEKLESKKLIIDALEESQQEIIMDKKYTKLFIISLVLTFLPILVFILIPSVSDRYFDMFAGQVSYSSLNYYFSFSPSFILDIPYFLTVMIWALNLWLCIKVRKGTIDRNPLLKHSNLALVVLNSVALAYSLWIIVSLF